MLPIFLKNGTQFIFCAKNAVKLIKKQLNVLHVTDIELQ